MSDRSGGDEGKPQREKKLSYQNVGARHEVPSASRPEVKHLESLERVSRATLSNEPSHSINSTKLRDARAEDAAVPSDSEDVPLLAGERSPTAPSFSAGGHHLLESAPSPFRLPERDPIIYGGRTFQQSVSRLNPPTTTLDTKPPCGAVFPNRSQLLEPAMSYAGSDVSCGLSHQLQMALLSSPPMSVDPDLEVRYADAIGHLERALSRWEPIEQPARGISFAPGIRLIPPETIISDRTWGDAEYEATEQPSRTIESPVHDLTGGDQGTVGISDVEAGCEADMGESSANVPRPENARVSHECRESSWCTGNRRSWRRRRKQLQHLLDTRAFTYGVLLVLCLDVLIILLELLALEGVFGTSPACHTMQQGHHGEESLFEEILHWTGMSILVFFNFDVFLHLIAFGRSFFHHMGYVADLIIAPTSLVLEINLPSTGSLLALLRMWRIVRVVHGVSLFSHEIGKEKLTALKLLLEEMRTENRDLRRKVKMLKQLYRNATPQLREEILNQRFSRRKNDAEGGQDSSRDAASDPEILRSRIARSRDSSQGNDDSNDNSVRAQQLSERFRLVEELIVDNIGSPDPRRHRQSRATHLLRKHSRKNTGDRGGTLGGLPYSPGAVRSRDRRSQDLEDVATKESATPSRTLRGSRLSQGTPTRRKKATPKHTEDL